MTISTALNRFYFNLAVRTIKKTASVRLNASGPTILSMVQHRDVLPYLLAIKSVARYLKAARIVVVADPTLNSADRELLAAHARGIEFREQAEFHFPDVPKGGCWERLCAIAEYVRDSYVIQLDADTVAVKRLQEVTQAISDQVAFTLRTEDDQQVQSCQEVAAWAKERLGITNHVQVVAESRLDSIEGADEYRYIRGCAGFAGYPQGSFNLQDIQEFSGRMAKVMPERWHEWGTEQFTSNVLVASMPGFRALPHPKYCAPHRRNSDTAFFHFIGYVRYATPLYAQLARKVAGEIGAA